jgi:hypothetical protein
MQSIVANLTPALVCQDHTTSPSARRAARQATQPRPPHSNPTLVTIAKRPSCGIEWRELVVMICPTSKAEYFSREYWTGQISLMSLRKIVDTRTHQKH